MGDTADAPKASKPVAKPTLSIIEWVQSFRIYTAILSKSQPHRVADLLGYQTLILQAHQEFKGDFWLRHDRTFRQKAATQKTPKWASIDTTFWSLAFSGQGKFGSYNERNRDQGSSNSTTPSHKNPKCVSNGTGKHVLFTTASSRTNVLTARWILKPPILLIKLPTAHFGRIQITIHYLHLRVSIQPGNSNNQFCLSTLSQQLLIPNDVYTYIYLMIM